MILSFRTDRPGQTVQTQIRQLLEEQSDQGLHCLPFRLHRLDSLVKPHSSNFRMITTNVLGVRKLRIITVLQGPASVLQHVLQSIYNYRKFPKYSVTQKICCNHSKILTMWLYYRVMSPNDADGMANSVVPDQTAPLIWVCTVCPGISIRKLRIITVNHEYQFLESFFHKQDEIHVLFM